MKHDLSPSIKEWNQENRNSLMFDQKRDKVTNGWIEDEMNYGVCMINYEGHENEKEDLDEIYLIILFLFFELSSSNLTPSLYHVNGTRIIIHDVCA